MIRACVQQWADEAGEVIRSIGLPLLGALAIPALEYVEAVNAEVARVPGAHILLCNGSATFTEGSAAELATALLSDPDVLIASARIDGQPMWAHPFNPAGMLVRAGVLAEHPLDARLRCYGWHKVLADQLGDDGMEWVPTADMRTIQHDERTVARGGHYYDELADDELADAIIGGRA